MDNTVDTGSFLDLLKQAKKSTDEAFASSPLVTRASKKVQDALKDTLAKTTNAVDIVAQKVKLNFKVLQDYDIDTSDLDTKTPPNEAIHVIVNWIVALFKDIIVKVNDQGEILAFTVAKLSEVLDRDANKDDLKQKHDDLEKHLTQRCDKIEKKCDDLANVDFSAAIQPDLTATKEELQKKHDDLEQQFAVKHAALEKNYDEVRQRCLKGNLIVSSPNRKTRNGRVIPSLANHVSDWDRFGKWRRENDMEMVIRLVQMKTGHLIDENDVIACHPLGNREKNTFIISVNNRTSDSAWDCITKGMMTADNNFSPDNVFINFQLTKRRGEISKEVRDAKKANLIKSYDIDVNGRIFVRNNGNDKQKIEILDLEQIRQYFQVGT